MSHVTTLYCTHCLFPNRFSGETRFSVSMFACAKCGKESAGSPVTQVWHDPALACFVPGCACREETYCDGCKKFSRGDVCPNCKGEPQGVVPNGK